MSEQLQSFKISDKVGRNATASTKASRPAAASDEKPSAGFPRVEALIDEYKTAAEAKDVFGDSIARVEGLLAVEKNAKKKAELVKVKRAFEHTMLTLDYLFQVRAELATQSHSGQSHSGQSHSGQSHSGQSHSGPSHSASAANTKK